MASDAVVNLVVNASDAETTVNAQLRRIADDAERRAPDISLNVTVDNTGVISAITRQTDELADRLDDVNFNLTRMTDLLDEIAANTAMNQLRDDTDDADRSTGRLTASLGSLGSSLGSVAVSAARLTVLSSVASQAIPAVGALVTSVESLVPAAAAGVAAFVTMKAAALTLKVGLLGVDEAIGAVFDPDADPAALEEALANLSDNARAFVLELRDMRPALDGLRLDVQDRLFRDLDATLNGVAKATFPAVERSAQRFADTFNAMARGVGSEARQLGSNGTLGRALSQGNDAFDQLGRIPGQVLTAIVQLAAAGGPLLNRFTSRIVDLADSASKALEDAFESGALEDAVNDAGDTLAQLGRIAGNVFGTIGNLFDAAGESGEGLFGTLEKITQALEDFTGSDQFQATLTALLELGAEVANAVLPLLLEAFNALLPVIQILAPPLQTLVELIGDQLAVLIPELAPVLEEMALLFGDILVAITPLIEQGIQLLIDIMPELIPLFQALSDLVVALTPLIEYFAVGLEFLLANAITGLIPILISFVDGLALVVGAIDDTLQWLVRFVGFLEGEVSTGVTSLNQLLDGDFRQSWNTAATTVATNSVGIADDVDSMARRVTQSSLSTANNVRNFLSEGFSDAADAVAQSTLSIVGYVSDLRTRIVSITVNLAGELYSAGQRIISSLADGILSQLGEATKAAASVVQGIRDFFPSSPAKRGPFSGRGYPYYSGQEVMASFARGVLASRFQAIRAINQAVEGLNPFGPPDTDPLSGIVGTGTEFAGIANTTFARLTPNVNVFIGNEQLNSHIQIVVDEDTLQRDRLASQGARG